VDVEIGFSGLDARYQLCLGPLGRAAAKIGDEVERVCRGIGLVKAARLAGVGVSAVQRIKAAMSVYL